MTKLMDRVCMPVEHLTIPLKEIEDPRSEKLDCRLAVYKEYTQVSLRHLPQFCFSQKL